LVRLNAATSSTTRRRSRHVPRPWQLVLTVGKTTWTVVCRCCTLVVSVGSQAFRSDS